MSDPKFGTKNEAIAYATDVLGYDFHMGTGECGDNGWGSREYYKAEDAELNEFGFPLRRHATVDYVCGSWRVHDFNDA